jgi:hypothetical protein
MQVLICAVDGTDVAGRAPIQLPTEPVVRARTRPTRTEQRS